MLKYKIVKDPDSKTERIETELRGKNLLINSLLNKGTAFTYQERLELGLLGKLPARVETLDDQVKRAYRQYKRYRSDLQRNIFLGNLHDKNEILFYHLVSQHLTEMMPMIYTPSVGKAVQYFSQEFRQPRGMYIAYPDQDRIDEILDNRTHELVDVIVATDGERVLGMGDQGVGAMDIPVAKLMVYTLCGGINPYHSMPVMLDVGTDNEKLLNDPLYLGWRHKRVRGECYHNFIDKFVSALNRKLPKAFLHWEDFGRDNARTILEKYRDKICSFNDDMQGTAVVTLAALLAATKRMDKRLSEQKILVYGAGTAGVGVTDQICSAMVREGLNQEDARNRFWLIDRDGLLLENMPQLTDFQKPYAKNNSLLDQWGPPRNGDSYDLLEVVKKAQPTVLIGCSAQGHAFNQELITTMMSYTDCPCILPLSNPNECSEANPADILAWTDGKALIATGSPFGKISMGGKQIEISQCNNALSFPGIGLGVITSRTSRLSDDMLWHATLALSAHTPISKDGYDPLLPNLEVARSVAKRIAIALVEQARREGLSACPEDIPAEKLVADTLWEPYYRTILPS